MKKSKAISLVLVTGLLGCNNHPQQTRLYLRTDTLENYTSTTPGYNGYYAFRPIGTYYWFGYVRQGYSSSEVHTSQTSISRGGFGESGGFHVSTSS
ncbi:hypothetical protein HDF24_12515 [Mucilaginibacter sp. X4EP1]|jgi:hypothetical protein|uniref:hypothetical protein n=1 Tax=Mucilaginibacter sp. X4EP1 TaxID=2723092 RepID=UPI002168B209|nr:hypothetical protein [Mucilaginibacter sp. X4EP1]MCS3813081.1 hypothetical protein [Mucilaginibacter sp. X4EP1]